jgi:hypothetical protein
VAFSAIAVKQISVAVSSTSTCEGPEAFTGGESIFLSKIYSEFSSANAVALQPSFGATIFTCNKFLANLFW